MSISKIVLLFMLLYIIIHLLNVNKTIKNNNKNNNKNKNIEKYVEKNTLIEDKILNNLFFSDKITGNQMKEHILKSFSSENLNSNYKEKIKEIFNLTNDDYKDLLKLPEGNKVKINLKKDWKYVLNNEIDSINNDIDIKFTKLGKDKIDSELMYNINSNVNEIFEYQISKFNSVLENLINIEKEEYVMNNTDFNNLFENKEFDYYKEYEKTMKKYDTMGNLIKITDNDNVLNNKNELLSNYDNIYTYETQCGVDKMLGSIVFQNEKNKTKKNKSIKNEIEFKKLNDNYGDDIVQYYPKYKKHEIDKIEDFPFKLIEYKDVTEGLVNNFKEIEEMILTKINKDLNLFILSNTLKTIKNLGNNFSIVDRKINYILKNTDKVNEYFYNGEIVIDRGRNHGIHIKIESLKQRSNYYITNYDILGIVISDKIEKVETIKDNINNPIYYKYDDKYVITKNELEKELAEIIDKGSIENFMYLFSKFKKIRADRGIMINDFELLMYTGNILYDIEHSSNFKKIDEINNPSIYRRIFGY